MMREWLRLEAACRRSRAASLPDTIVFVVTAAILVAGTSLSAEQRSEGMPFSSGYLRAGATLCADDAVWTGPSSPPRLLAAIRGLEPVQPGDPAPGPAWRRTPSRVVARLLGFGPLQHLTAGDAGTARTTTVGRPTSTIRAIPVFTVHCTEPWGTCPVEGMRRRDPRRRARSRRHRRPSDGRRPGQRLGVRLLARAVQAAGGGRLVDRVGRADAHRRRRPGLLRGRGALRHARRPAACPRSSQAGRSTTRSRSACTATRARFVYPASQARRLVRSAGPARRGRAGDRARASSSR